MCVTPETFNIQPRGVSLRSAGKRSEIRPPIGDRTGELYPRFFRIPHGLSVFYAALTAIHLLKVMTERVHVEHIHVKVFSHDTVMSGLQQRVNRFG